jgi:hypothetical protein
MKVVAVGLTSLESVVLLSDRRIGVSSPRKLRQDRHRIVCGRECHALGGTVSDVNFIETRYAGGMDLSARSADRCLPLSSR